MNTINFKGRETLLTTAIREAEKVAKSPNHEYTSDSMLGFVEREAKQLKDNTAELTEAYKAKYAPFSLDKNNPRKELEKFTEEYNRSHGNV